VPGVSRAVLGVALFGCSASLSLFSTAAAPADGAAARTIALSATGTARWTSDGSTDSAHLTLSYRWGGSLTFAASSATTTLRASWTGHLTGKNSSGAYACTYKGVNVPARVTATLTKGKSLRLVLAARGRGFFPSKGDGATVSCNSGVGARGPSHFEPEWLFRDALQDHGRLTSAAAVLVVPKSLLPRGSVALRFPSEAGFVAQPLRPRLTWSNSGRVTIRAR
jgi:hypothetical protein